jgi:hypothetical protein
LDLVLKVINDDIRKWVEDEKAYKFIMEATRNQESLIQKTIKTQLENGLLKRGLRKDEVDIRREEQLLDDTRTDFLISYGFVGPVLIEIKRVDNPEIKNEQDRINYKSKLLSYIEGYSADYGIFLVFQINESVSIEKYLPILRELYRDCRNVTIEGVNSIN